MSEITKRKVTLGGLHSGEVVDLMPETTAEQVKLNKNENLASKLAELIAALNLKITTENAIKLVKEEIAKIVDGAPETADTLNELAELYASNKDLIDALNTAIGTRALASDLTAHVDDKENPHGVTKEQIGLDLVDNTADADKSVKHAVSAEQDGDGNVISQTYVKNETVDSIIGSVNNDILPVVSSHTTDTSNPHKVTKAQIGLDLVDNTADADKSVKHAINADMATKDANGNTITSTYATKDELEAVVSGEEVSFGATVYVSATQPSEAKAGDLWFRTYE